MLLDYSKTEETKARKTVVSETLSRGAASQQALALGLAVLQRRDEVDIAVEIISPCKQALCGPFPNVHFLLLAPADGLLFVCSSVLASSCLITAFLAAMLCS